MKPGEEGQSLWGVIRDESFKTQLNMCPGLAARRLPAGPPAETMVSEPRLHSHPGLQS